jgi:hypothetical protein
LGPFALLAALGACDRPPQEALPAPPAAPDPAVVRTALESLGQHYKVYTLNSDARAIASLFARDGRLEVFGSPSMAGPVAIDAGLRAGFASVKYKTWEIHYGDIEALSSDVAVARGSTYTVAESKGKTVRSWNRWMAAYKRGADGMYRIQFLAAFPDSSRTSGP